MKRQAQEFEDVEDEGDDDEGDDDEVEEARTEDAGFEDEAFPAFRVLRGKSLYTKEQKASLLASVQQPTLAKVGCKLQRLSYDQLKKLSAVELAKRMLEIGACASTTSGTEMPKSLANIVEAINKATAMALAAPTHGQKRSGRGANTSSGYDAARDHRTQQVEFALPAHTVIQIKG